MSDSVPPPTPSDFRSGPKAPPPQYDLVPAVRPLVVRDLITMSGGVVLTQCNNVLRGDRLLVDMTTGVSRVESDSGKVQVLVDQSGQGCGSPASSPKMPLPTPSAGSKPK